MRKYENIVSDRYCCVGAALEAVLKSHGYCTVDQYDIVNEFGLVVPIDAHVSKNINNKHYSQCPSEWGVKLKKDSINDLFIKYKVGLYEEYLSIFAINDYQVESLLRDKIIKSDIIFGFDYGQLHKCEKSRGVGHVGIILEVENNIVYYLDPGPEGFGIRSANVDDLYMAIKSKSDGFWVISEKI